jgi:hypothetical protein
MPDSGVGNCVRPGRRPAICEKNFLAPLCGSPGFWFDPSATLKGLDPVTEHLASFESALAERTVPLAAARLAAALGLARVALILISPNPSGAERPGA